MDTTRMQKYARLIQKEIGDIFQREGRNYFGGSFLTVTGVKVTPDLSIARVYVSTFHEKGTDVLEKLHAHEREIRKHLGTRIRNQARIVPSLEFFIDDSLDYAEKIDKIMKNLDIPPDAPEEDDEK
ncbi:MAG TPA: 30S ribosome-binding factor RbfA [Bacteroidia bacterium]|nr:30S ribosome-binding factor RbfA [Bacteroidia bacterium]